MKYPDDFIDKIMCGDCVEFMKYIPDNCIDLVVTSPPYDNLRTYNGYVFDFENIARELYRIIKIGGVVVWIVGDATIKGNETGTSFRQALYFKEIGFNLHDTMIWNKGGFSAVGSLKVRYAPVFEYMLIFSRGKIKTFNPLKDKRNVNGGKSQSGTIRQKDGSTKPMSKTMIINEYGQRYNIWDIFPERQKGENTHPAPFPKQLAQDHILSWSNEKDLILDPMCGSGTTCIMAQILNRHFIGIDISREYCNMAREKINGTDMVGA